MIINVFVDSINSLANKQEINKTQLIRKILQEYVERRK